MEDTASYRFLSLHPYRTPTLKSNKESRVTRRKLQVADLEEGAENLGETISINRTSNVVQMPNGEIWHYGGRIWKQRPNGVSYHLVWKDTASEPTEYPAKGDPRIEELRLRALEIDELKQSALEQIDYPWPSLGTSIEFISYRRGWMRKRLGCAFLADNRIEIYLTTCDELIDVAHTVAHEIGHIVDWICLTDEDRSDWRRLRGFSQDYPWYGSRLRPDWKDPSGDFAECFAAWQVPGASVCTSRPITDEILDLVADLAGKSR